MNAVRAGLGPQGTERPLTATHAQPGAARDRAWIASFPRPLLRAGLRICTLALDNIGPSRLRLKAHRASLELTRDSLAEIAIPFDDRH